MEKLTLTVAQAATALGISTNLAYSMVREGRIPSIRMGTKRIVIPRLALEKFIEESALRRASA